MPRCRAGVAFAPVWFAKNSPLARATGLRADARIGFRRFRPASSVAAGRGMNGRTPIHAFTEGMPKTSNTKVTGQTKTAKLKAA